MKVNLPRELVKSCQKATGVGATAADAVIMCIAYALQLQPGCQVRYDRGVYTLLTITRAVTGEDRAILKDRLGGQFSVEVSRVCKVL